MAKIIDITGQKYGLLTAISINRRDRYTYWNCLCDCGKAVVVRGSNMRSGQASSCGCLRAESTRKRRLTHGKTRTAEYNIWAGMINRCVCEKNPYFDRYGARGIFVCSEWKNDFAAFLRDMGERPSKKHSIDRIDNEDGYHKDNCRWTTSGEQARNKASNIFVSVDGIELCIHDCFTTFDLCKTSYYNLKKVGHSPQEAIDILLLKKHHKQAKNYQGNLCK